MLIHGVIGGLTLLGLSRSMGKWIAWVGFGLIMLHVIFCTAFTVKAVKSGQISGKWYLRENALFWARRISGLCILVLVFFHFGLFGHMTAKGYVLYEFTTMRLAVQLLLGASLFTHIFINIRPLFISFGIPGYKKYKISVFFALSVFLLFCTTAVVCYYAGILL
ncbi:MAG: hypothetical protein LBB48_03530 [Treponema sp.]|nr:hypothetical protein [Treponema sp.]